MSEEKNDPTDETTRERLREIRATLAQAAEDFATAMRIPLPTEHDVSCPTFCPGPESHAYGAIARTLHDVSALHEALAKAMLHCGAAINGATLHTMTAAIASASAPSSTSEGAAGRGSVRPSRLAARVRRAAR